MQKILLKYLPEDSLPTVLHWFELHRFHLTISRSRSSKLGDFRPGNRQKPHRISVNGDLNPYHFLITLTHEVAHLINWNKHQNKVRPHGSEWQNEYKNLLNEITDCINFPDEIQEQLKTHALRPKASSCGEPELYKVLKKYDSGNNRVFFLEDLPKGSLFCLSNRRVFQKGDKRRSRFECKDQQNGKIYLINGHASISPIK